MVSQQQQQPTWTRNGIVYRLADEADMEQVQEIIIKEFFPNLPMLQYPPTESPEEFAKVFVQEVLSRKVTLVAVDESSGDIVGARLNVVEAVDGYRFTLPKMECESMQRYRRFFMTANLVHEIESAVDCFQRYQVDKAFCFKMLSVKQSYGRRGIGKQLNIFSIEMAKSMGIQLVIGSTEMLYSQKINESLGFETVHRIKYKDYVDRETGERPFVALDATVHKEAVMFAKVI